MIYEKTASIKEDLQSPNLESLDRFHKEYSFELGKSMLEKN